MPPGVQHRPATRHCNASATPTPVAPDLLKCVLRASARLRTRRYAAEPSTVRAMTKVILMYGPEHGRILTTETTYGEVLREGGWSYQLTDDVDEQGRRIARAYMD